MVQDCGRLGWEQATAPAELMGGEVFWAWERPSSCRVGSEGDGAVSRVRGGWPRAGGCALALQA